MDSKSLDLIKLKLLDEASKSRYQYCFEDMAFIPRLSEYEKLEGLTHKEKLFWLNRQIFDSAFKANSRISIDLQSFDLVYRVTNPSFSPLDLFDCCCCLGYSMDWSLIYPIAAFVSITDRSFTLVGFKVSTLQNERILVCFNYDFPQLKSLLGFYISPTTIVSSDCQQCTSYHGKTYNDTKFHCAINPYGIDTENCQDFDLKYTQETERVPLQFQEKITRFHLSTVVRYFSSVAYKFLDPKLRLFYSLSFILIGALLALDNFGLQAPNDWIWIHWYRETLHLFMFPHLFISLVKTLQEIKSRDIFIDTFIRSETIWLFLMAFWLNAMKLYW